MPYQLTVQRNLNFYNVKDYTAQGNGTNDDTAAIQAAINAAHANGGGTMFSPFGNYLISSALTIYSNITLLSAQGVTYTLAASLNCNMLVNAAVTPQRSVTDAAITTATTTLTSATANFTSTDVGRTVVVTGAWNGSNNLCTTIASVQSTTSCTLTVAATATVSGASCSIFTRDTNIEIAGGTWNRGNNGNASSAQVASNTTNLRHIDNLYIHDATFVYGTLKSYNLALVDVTNVSVKHITLNGPNTVFNTDGVCIDGPCQYVQVDGIYGTTGDDFVSFHTVSLDTVAGNQSEIVVTNLYPNLVGQAAFKSHADNGTIVSSLTVRGIHGSALSGAVHLQDYTTPSTSIMTDILVEDVDCAVSSTTMPLVIVYTSNSKGTVVLRNLIWRTGNGTGAQVVQFPNNSTLGTLVVDGLRLEQGTTTTGVYVNGALSNLVVTNVTAPDNSQQLDAVVSCDTLASIKTCTISNVIVYFTTNAANPILTNKSNMKAVAFNNIYIYNGGLLLLQKNAGATLQVLANNITLDSAYQLAQLVACAADFSISNLNVYTTNQSVLIALTTAGSNLSIRGHGLINPNNKTAFSRDGTQTVRINHSEMLADISLLTPGDQDMVNNNNGALSSGAGICIFHTGGTGNGWKNIYSGNTY